MSKDIDDLRRAFDKRLTNAAADTFYAEVTGADEAARTCTVTAEGVTYENVLLYAIEKPELKGRVIIPAAGSTVLVKRIGKGRYMVSMFSEVEKVLFTFGETVSGSMDASEAVYENGNVTLHISGEEVKLDAPKIIFNGGGFDGFVKIRELEKNLNTLKKSIETIHAALPDAFKAVGVAMSAAGANGATAYEGATAGLGIDFSDMENDTIKH